MGTSYIGDETIRGLDNLYQGLDVARMTGTHLHHCQLVTLV